MAVIESESWVVSPFVRTVRAQAAVVLARRLRTGEATRVESGDLVVLVDALRSTIIIVTARDHAALARLRRAPAGVGAFASAEPAAFARLRAADLFLTEREALSRHAFRSVEIEINRHCNFRCSFCPVEVAPKPKAFMSPDLFTHVLGRVAEYGARSVSLNHYSEPTLDPDLIARIREAAQFGLSVRLFTNASLFTEEKIRQLAELGNTRVVVNLPTLDQAEYERVTGTKLFHRVLANLELLHRHGIRTELSVNVPRGIADETVRAINDRLAGWFGEAVRWATDSRGGLLAKPEYVTEVHHLGRLSGCAIALGDLNVSHEGKAFLCCQDFDQRYELGDLRTQSIREIADGERAVAIRRMLLGLADPEPNLICTRCAWTQPLREGPARLFVGSEDKVGARAQADLLRNAPITWADIERPAVEEVVS
ncbi:Molybdenum cofactor biosynthesis protein MoaA [Minicystis rosea]|nr:Molybdenum cofactor biosynthesis protein MoaA [Minicystis rosea]